MKNAGTHAGRRGAQRHRQAADMAAGGADDVAGAVEMVAVITEGTMRSSQVQKKLRQLTDAFLRDLFAPDPVPLSTDPATGAQAVDIRQVWEKLGLDPQREMDKVLTDPVLSQGIRFISRDVR